MEKAIRARRVRFGVFEVDLRSGELRKQGIKQKLQDKPFQVLAALVGSPGDLVTREELRQRLWPDNTFVDFDHLINIAINKLREALDDSAENPRFVETLPRYGYRFLAPVQQLEDEDKAPSHEAEKGDGTTGRRWPAKAGWALSGVLLGVIGYLALPYMRPSKTMLLVLPFENLSGEPRQDYISDGLTEELIAQLGKLNPEKLRVLARTTSMAYKHTTKPASQIGREMGVNYIIEGSVRQSNHRVRIVAQLIQVSDQTHVLTETFERDLSDVLALQSDVARAAADEIEIKLTPVQLARLERHRSVDPEAYLAYLRGRSYWNARTPDGLQKGIEFFNQAISRDPTYAPPYAGLADSYSLLAANGYDVLPPHEALPKAKAAALKAIELDETLAEAHTSLASARLVFDWDWAGAEKEFKRALELNPSYSTAHQWYGLYLRAMGRLDDAIEENKRALALDSRGLVTNVALAEAFYFSRKYDEAIDQCRRTLEIDPNFFLPYYIRGRVYEEKRMYPEALAEFEKGGTLSGNSPLMLMGLGHAYGASGNRKEAKRLLAQLEDLSRQRYVPPLYIAGVYEGLGEQDQAFAWLEKAFGERSDHLIYLERDPIADPTRTDPRFIALARRIGLPP